MAGISVLRQAQTRQSSPDRHALSPVPPPQGTLRPPQGRPGAAQGGLYGALGNNEVLAPTSTGVLGQSWDHGMGTSTLLSCHHRPPRAEARRGAGAAATHGPKHIPLLAFGKFSRGSDGWLCISPTPSKVARPPSAPGSLINNENTSWNSPAARDRASIVSSSHYLFDHSNAINSVTPTRRTVI